MKVGNGNGKKDAEARVIRATSAGEFERLINEAIANGFEGRGLPLHHLVTDSHGTITKEIFVMVMGRPGPQASKTITEFGNAPPQTAPDESPEGYH